MRELPFTMAEYQARVERVRAKMDERGLDVLLLPNIVYANYLTGYQSAGPSYYTCMVVPLRGDPTLVVWELELQGVYDSSWVKDGAIVRTGEDSLKATRRVLDERGLLGGVIGIDKHTAYLSADDYERLTSELASCRLGNGTGNPEGADASQVPSGDRVCSPGGRDDGKGDAGSHRGGGGGSD